MANIKIDRGKCKGCCLCVAECPRGNIRMSEIFNKSGHSFAEILDLNDCTGCALCCQICPDIAIQIEDGKKTGKIPIKESVQHKSTKELIKKVE